MQKFIVRVVVALVVLCGASYYVYKTNDVNETYENKESKEDNNMLSMMLETSAGSGEYQKTSASAWPTEGYVFNENLSKCEKGSSLNWDSTKKTVVMTGNVSDKCYVYFDKEIILLSKYIKSQYTGTQGENNLYLHNSTLENGAGDNSYRYAGSSETTNNFVCFGYDSTDGCCPTDYLYRIIGVFDNHIKLIKWDYAKTKLLGTDGDYYNTYKKLEEEYSSTYGTNKGSNDKTEIGAYYWNYDNKRSVWAQSQLNTVNLNTNYLNNIGTSWSNKIAMHTWKVGGNYYEYITSVIPALAYKNEIASPSADTTYDAKIGLMYASDYGYSAAPSAWTTTLNSYSSSSVTSVNWMYMGLNEWTITRQTNDKDRSLRVDYNGYLSFTTVDFYQAVRPCFYLNSDVTYVSGKGTKTEPIIIN